LIKEENAKGAGSDPFDPSPLLQHTLGIVVYLMVFGKEYEIDDPIWKWLQHLQEEGTKLIGVAGPLNFLPWLRHFFHTFTLTIEILITFHVGSFQSFEMPSNS